MHVSTMILGYAALLCGSLLSILFHSFYPPLKIEER